MSKLTGGLFSRPSGKNSGLVFSSARTSRGKRATARNYVIPTQPGTEKQQIQKWRVKDISLLYNFLPSRIKRQYLKQMTGVFTGYQALFKMFAGILTYDVAIQAYTRLYYGDLLPLPESFKSGYLANVTNLQYEWSTELSGVASASDQFFSFGIQNQSGRDGPGNRYHILVNEPVLRSDGGYLLETDFMLQGVITVSFFVNLDQGLVSDFLVHRNLLF